MEFTSSYLTGAPLITGEGWFYARKINTAATQDWANYIEKIGVANWIEEQLYPENLAENPQYEQERQALFPSVFISAPNNKTREKHFFDTYQPKSRNHSYEVATYVIEAALHRLWRSNKQLQGTMALFWADILASSIEKSPNGYHDYVGFLFDGALGKYKDLLYRITTSQTMAYFLDNVTNTRYALNENMGRELMELHSWGIDKGYAEIDVRKVALLLTGVRGNIDTEFTEAKPELHYFGPLTVAGKLFANGGRTTADIYRTVRQLTDHLATDRYTGLRISRRLIQYFIGQDADYEPLAQNLATTYIANDTDIRPVLRQLFNSAEFRQSGGKTVRRPWAVLCSTLASGGLTLKGSNNLSDTANMYKPLYKIFSLLKYSTGGVPFDAPATNGYSLDAQDWISSVSYMGTSRFNRFVNYLSKWDENSVDSLARWANPIDWTARIGIRLGSTGITDAAGMIFSYLTGYQANNPELVKAVAAYATQRTASAVVTGQPRGVVTSAEQVNRMVEAVMTAPHLLVS